MISPRSELAKLRRGLNALREAFGLQFTAAIIGVAALLLWGIARQHGAVACVACLIFVLLAIRTHDIGDVPDDEEEPSEYQTFWDPSRAAQRAREDAFLAEQLEEAEARAAQARFIQSRAQAALGKPHEPVEL